MSPDLLKEFVSLGSVVLNTVVMYLLLIIGISKIGGRLRSQIGFGELLIVALLGSSVETSLIAGNVSLAAGLVSLSTLLVTNWVLTKLLHRHPRFRHLILGQPVVLFNRGKMFPRRMRSMGMDEDDLLEGVRLRGYETFDQVKMIILEIDGSLSVIPKEKGKKEKPGGKTRQAGADQSSS